jgi:hypothetical protein
MRQSIFTFFTEILEQIFDGMSWDDVGWGGMRWDAVG